MEIRNHKKKVGKGDMDGEFPIPQGSRRISSLAIAKGKGRGE